MSAREDGDPALHVRRRRREVHAPVAIWEDVRLKLATRAILPYLLHLQDRPTWEIRVSAVLHALGVARATWNTARRDMEAHGYYRADKFQLPAGALDAAGKNVGGKWVWKHWITDIPNFWEDDRDAFPSPPRAGDRLPSARPPIARAARNKQDLDLHDPDLQKRAAAKRVKPAAAQSEKEKKEYSQSPAGIVCWSCRDRAAAAQIEAGHPAAAVAAAIVAVVAGRNAPVPGLVAIEIQHAAHEKARAAAEAARHAAARSAPESREQAAAKAAAAMAEIAALQGSP